MSTLSQIFPPKPDFTEHNLPDQSGRVILITGAASGIGYQLAKILYSVNATVYIAARSERKIDAAISSLRKECPGSKGDLKPLILDLSDLTTIKPAAKRFLAQQNRLHVLVHNAGVMMPPKGSRDRQGHDLEMGTNCLGPFVLNWYLQDILRQTAGLTGVVKGSVRVVWLASFIQTGTAKGGILFDAKTDGPKVLEDPMQNYMQSKVGNLFLANEWAEKLGVDGIVSISVHPGLMRTELQRHANPLMGKMMGLIFKPAIYGAYTELFAGFSADIQIDKHNGELVIPWGRHGPIVDHIAVGLRSREEGGTGLSKQFWDWCSKETMPYH